MEIIQESGSIRHRFTFEDEHCNFAYEDRSGAGDADIAYAALPLKANIQIERKEWLNNVGFIWCLLGLFQLGSALYQGTSLSGKSFWLAIGLVCLLWAHFSKVKYTVFKTENGNIFVMQGKKHDEIVAELDRRRKKQLMEWYGDVNPEHGLEHEVSKFQWLREQDVISDEELKQKISEAEMLYNPQRETVRGLLN